MIEVLVQREVEEQNEKITFGYTSYDLIIGSDHGAGACRFVAKLKLIGPTFKHANNKNVEFRCLKMRFGYIKCKKDRTEILRLV